MRYTLLTISCSSGKMYNPREARLYFLPSAAEYTYEASRPRQLNSSTIIRGSASSQVFPGQPSLSSTQPRDGVVVDAPAPGQVRVDQRNNRKTKGKKHQKQ